LLEGFVESSVNAFEANATEAVCTLLKEQHGDAQVLPIREITSADGQMREVDGVVVAGGCAAIVEAEQVVDAKAVSQLTSCLDFMR
jgi:hypothetical protein